MSGIFFVGSTDNLQATISEMDRITQDWTMRAARQECGWICADCCASYPEGMPDECAHGIQACTDICLRDKRDAQL